MNLYALFKDEYKRKARLFPATLSSIPAAILLWLLAYYALETSSLIRFLGSLLASLTFAVCALEWFGVMLVCWTGRAIERVLFDNGNRFPSTEILLCCDNYLAKQTKKSVRNKISKDLDIKLLSQKQEDKDIVEARKTIRDAIDRVRKIVGDGRTVLQYNIHYGAIRNLIGGCCFACPLSVCVAELGWAGMRNGFVTCLGIALFVVYLLPLLFLSPLLKSFGYRYARILLAEYMEIKVG